MNAKPKVAVIMATYNGANFVEDQLRSIISQKDVHVTIFIRDDCSSDNTHSIINQIAKKHRDIIILRSTGKQSGRASRNFLEMVRQLDLGKFDFVAFSDQDDIWLSEKLKRSIKFANETNAELVSTSLIAFWNNGKQKLIYECSKQTRFDYIFQGSGNGCTFLLRNSLYNDFRCFVLNHTELIKDFYHHDWLVFFQLL